MSSASAQQAVLLVLCWFSCILAGQDAAEAANAFRKIANAYEILGDQHARRNYDRYGDAPPQQRGGGAQRHYYGGGDPFAFFERFFGQQQRYHGPMYGGGRLIQFSTQIRAAQARCLTIHSVDHLLDVVADAEGRAEKHVLLAVYPQSSSEFVDVTMAFPYPFAGMGAQKVWWEDIVQTGKVVHNRHDNELTRLLKVDAQDRTTDVPVFVWIRRGDKLDVSTDFSMFRAMQQSELEDWVWKQLQIEVVFHNEHENPVQMWWVHGNRAEPKGHVLAPGGSSNPGHTAHLSHEFWAIDNTAKLRNQLHADSSVAIWKATTFVDGVLHLVIKQRDCIDRDSMCSYWATHPHGECDNNPTFMKSTCRVSCGACTRDPVEMVPLKEFRKSKEYRNSKEYRKLKEYRMRLLQESRNLQESREGDVCWDECKKLVSMDVIETECDWCGKGLGCCRTPFNDGHCGVGVGCRDSHCCARLKEPQGNGGHSHDEL